MYHTATLRFVSPNLGQKKHKKRSKKSVERILHILPIFTLLLPFIYVYGGIVLPKPKDMAIIAIYTENAPLQFYVPNVTNITLKSYEYREETRFKILKDISHKFTYCTIAKNANTLFK
eukprot:55134_1